MEISTMYRVKTNRTRDKFVWNFQIQERLIWTPVGHRRLSG